MSKELRKTVLTPLIERVKIITILGCGEALHSTVILCLNSRAWISSNKSSILPT